MIYHCEIESGMILFEFKTHEKKGWWPFFCDVLIFSKFESTDSKLLEISSQNADLFKKNNNSRKKTFFGQVFKFFWEKNRNFYRKFDFCDSKFLKLIHASLFAHSCQESTKIDLILVSTSFLQILENFTTEISGIRGYSYQSNHSLTRK